MLVSFPEGTFAIVRSSYERPYPNPIAVRAGDDVRPLADGSMTTDFLGWTWCTGPDGRSGWVPDNWCERAGDRWRLLRDFDALELSVTAGERLRVLFSESGFVMAERSTGERGWVPDAILELDEGREGSSACAPGAINAVGTAPSCEP